MFKIIGSDGKEYGPVSADQLRQWLTEGRVNAQTQIQPEGSTGWLPLSAFPEFAASFPAPAPAPLSGSASPAYGDRQRALGLVSGPAIGLIVTAALGFLGAVFNVLSSLTGFNSWQTSGATLPPEFQQVQEMMVRFQGAGALIGAGIAFLMAALTLFAALRMRKLQSFGLCMTVSILAMIPCLSPCCCVGLPIGIWALVVLNKPEVKPHFT